MLIPKKVKHRKWHKGRGRNKRIASNKIALAYGSYGLKAQTPAWISSRQIEAARRVMTRYLRKGGKMWIRIFPDHPITRKGSEVPMGAGKGAVEHYVIPVRPGTVMFEIDGVADDQAKEALRLAAYKLPVKTTVISR
ncbi:50S ribosomal protein L16 [Patescibacteria group bacterium]|uniref:Large ribosomal subunit protein uL16 n=1 Tax=candidate division WWE3 bacterium TaxID=2053526 RepID=A0A928TSP2_UNCKA|nr:50S ribosomal protein L16 [candidate division WWE3 bacterium]MCL4732760.1 50S ribosomal protein L16 [Patescibacteria group bacterium]MDL1952922.1 50S ribosomal protein L16 [Candidatus Uhrbacteria bacterium UHB]RIL00642.1 MAG: 50S ribosomal protein L16 [Candidatus Uhrbacteria bacterium]